MPIRLHAEQVSEGVLLSRIYDEDDAESVRLFFVDIGITAGPVLQSQDGDYRIELPRTTTAVLLRAIEGANIELV